MKYLGLPLSVSRLKRIHFQPLEDKVAAKLVPWVGKHVTMAGRSCLVKSVLTSVVTYFIAVLDVPIEVLAKIDSLRRAYLWAACDKVTGGKCKVNWDLVCKPKDKGGLGILNLKKFATALRLRWLWQEWKNEDKPWVGLGSPCTTKDHDLFAAATTVIVGDGEKVLFWEASWLDGMRPKDVAPLIFEISRKKKCSVLCALHNDFWVSQINTQNGLSLEHLEQFYKLWEKLVNVSLHPQRPDAISWKLTNDGLYSAKSAYNMQFLGLTTSLMPPLVWKPWATPKCKFFAWLVLQNRVWTADRLARRGWPNCGLCKLCNQRLESAAHLLFKCRFSIRIWNKLKLWLGLHQIDTALWQQFHSVKEWWKKAIHKKGPHRKALASLTMLVSWELWKERNARVFRGHSVTVDMMVTKIKNEARLWCFAGAKALSSLIFCE
uniref:Uncharacterized protein n=1 Tax=Avena sativa TaxID=4498 RepID=A0ACD6AK31_AVESA